MIKMKSLLTEDIGHNLNGRILISVDVQPEYGTYLGFSMESYCQFINESYEVLNRVVFLYNGSKTLGMIGEEEYKEWLSSNGLNQEIIDQSVFYDKGYAFFRYCMDSGAGVEATANFVRFMYQNGVNDSRDMTRDLWASYLRQNRRLDKKEIYDLLKKAEDCVHIPDLMEFLKRYNGVVLTGGGVTECLREVVIALKALNKTYTILDEYTY